MRAVLDNEEQPMTAKNALLDSSASYEAPTDRVPSIYDFNHTEEEAAEGLGIAVISLRKRRAQGLAPPSVKVGREVLYPKDPFRAYLQNPKI